MATDRQEAVRLGAEALHADWEPEEPTCDGRCHNDAELVIDALYGSGYVVIRDAPDHFVTFDEDGWFIEHSVACRVAGTIGTCEYNAAIREIADEPDPDQFGRWRITNVDDELLPSLERAPMGTGGSNGTS